MADYFVRIENGAELRRNLLQSSKLNIHILKQEHQIDRIRQEKRLLLNTVRTELKEITFLLNELEQFLPSHTKKELEELMPGITKRKTEIMDAPIQPAKGKKGKKGKAAPIPKAVPRSAELSKLEKLEDSLNMIENRLNKL
jgi:hypothetical protein